MNEQYICKYCGRICKNKNSLTQHEIRCKENPNHIICYGNKGNMPQHTNGYYKKQYVTRSGDILDITNEQLEIYKSNQKTCEICGKTIDEAVKWNSDAAPKNLCVDHDHETKQFRGLLCSVCNRQLGWYEKHSDKINKYLSKDFVNQNKNIK